MGCDGKPGGEGEEVQHTQQTGGNTDMHLVCTLLTDSVSAVTVVTMMTGRTTCDVEQEPTSLMIN